MNFYYCDKGLNFHNSTINTLDLPYCFHETHNYDKRIFCCALLTAKSNIFKSDNRINYMDHVYFVHPSTDVSVDISTDTRPICRSTYRSTHGRYIDRDMSVDTSVDISTDTSVDMSVDISTESVCPIVGRHVDR